MPSDWYDQLKEWFEYGEEDAELSIDEEWTVEDHPEFKRGLLVSHPKLQFSIGVNIRDEVIQLIMYSSIATDTIPNKDRVMIYRDLLVMNDESNFVKFILIGRHDIIALRTDIDPQYLNKAEFNNILNHFILAGRWLINKISPPEEEGDSEQQMMETLKTRIRLELEQGTAEAAIVDLFTSAGIPEELATELIKAVKSELAESDEASSKKYSDPTSYIQ